MQSLALVAVLLASASVTTGSWLCPVFTPEQIPEGEFPASRASASIVRWEGVIRPVPLLDESMRDYAEWDYQINETLVLAPEDDTEEFHICLDLGVGPEERRKLQTITIDGVPVQPCSMIAVNASELVSEYESGLFIFGKDRYDDGLTPFILKDIDSFRSRFSNEMNFRSAVPECGCFYVMLYRIENPEEELVIEASYISMGWTHLTGAAPLFFSVLQPGLWKGPVTASSITVDLSGIPDRDSWLVESEEDIRSGSETLAFNLDGLDECLPDRIKGVTVRPPGLQ